jgi:hypothetical protein
MVGAQAMRAAKAVIFTPEIFSYARACARALREWARFF